MFSLVLRDEFGVTGEEDYVRTSNLYMVDRRIPRWNV